MDCLSPLEIAVAFALAPQVSPTHTDALVAQLRTARVTSRDFTGVGFYTQFDVDRSLPQAEVTTSPGGWIESKVGPDAYPLEFMLYVRDGFATMIEAYSYFDGYGDLDLLTAEFTPPVEADVNRV